ncbi:MAG TPA: DUF433 domain-containing protein [Micropepsaceae bacterium]|nr:DUF433 domain-containing protein [Micropepsaceae bacterium]
MRDLLNRVILTKIEAEGRLVTAKPVIRGTRIAVEQIVRELATGMTATEVASKVGLTIDDIRAACAYAAARLAEERIELAVEQ